MSSADEDQNEDQSGAIRTSKKRRVQRACDVCRRKKIRCDGSQMPGNRCSNCIAYNYECSYVEAAKKRGPPKGYVENLETRLEKMEGLLQRLCPDADFTQELGMPLKRPSTLKEYPLKESPPAPLIPAANSSPSVLGGNPNTSPNYDPDALDPSDDEYGHAQMLLLQKTFNEMSVSHRFFGKSSGVQLVQTAMDMKSEYVGRDPRPTIMHMHNRRNEFWTMHPWERSSFKNEGRRYDYPEPDLLETLVNLYFANINIFLSLLHRPTFEQGLADGLHLRDDGFGALVLIVCATASRYSDDPRVRLEGTDSWHSSGWKWFVQVEMIRKSLLSAPCLYDLQMYSLGCLFLQGCSAPQACWTMVGIGLRLAQEVGAHRKKVYGAKLSVEDELWKRAFWVLVVLDRLMSASLGRPCAIQEEDFDLDLPVECDDEYWTHPDPEQAFKQPAGKPCQTSYFISFLKLNQILAFALRTIYSINKSKILLGFVGQQWEQHIVAELDSALNKWIDSVPDHLRWDPTREDHTFFLQSASLYSTFYHIQILVHRPFIPSPRKPSPLSFPSLAICTNAARSCSHIVDQQRRRLPGRPSPHFQLPAFTAGIVLLLSIWGVKRSGVTIDPMKEMADVHKCMAALKEAEGRWHAAGRLWDVLYELASVGDLPLPSASPSSKRGRDSDSPTSAGLIPSLAQTPSSTSSVSLPVPPSPADHLHAGRTCTNITMATEPVPISQRSAFAMPHYDPTPSPPEQPPFLMSGSSTGGLVPPIGPASTSTKGASLAATVDYPRGTLPIQDNIPVEQVSMESSMFNSSAQDTDTMTNMWYMPPPPAGFDVSVPDPQPPLLAGRDGYASMPEIRYSPRSFGFLDQAVALEATGQPGQMYDELMQGMPRDETTDTIWSTVPSGYELEDWDSYISSVSGLTHPQGGMNGH